MVSLLLHAKKVGNEPKHVALFTNKIWRETFRARATAQIVNKALEIWGVRKQVFPAVSLFLRPSVKATSHPPFITDFVPGWHYCKYAHFIKCCTYSKNLRCIAKYMCYTFGMIERKTNEKLPIVRIGIFFIAQTMCKQHSLMNYIIEFRL